MNIAKSIIEVHMGDSFDRLRPLLQSAHQGQLTLTGKAVVERGNWLASVLCNILNFPKRGENVNLHVDCSHSATNMQWQRNFNGLIMTSNFELNGAYLVEHLGPLKLYCVAQEQEGKLHYNFKKTKFLGIYIPRFLAPKIVAYEYEKEGKYCFYVYVSMFLMGKTIAYRGVLDLNRVDANDAG